MGLTQYNTLNRLAGESLSIRRVSPASFTDRLRLVFLFLMASLPCNVNSDGMNSNIQDGQGGCQVFFEKNSWMDKKMVNEGETRRIPLTRGYFATVDAEDYDWLCNWVWRANGYDDYVYACRQYRDPRIKDKKGEGKRIYVAMHRLIMNAPGQKYIDHIDGNRLNNTKKNLRFCTCSENLQNQVSKGRFSSPYKGVSARNGKYLVSIRYKGTPIYLGQFSRESAAARTYDKLAKILFGEFANLNFPEIQAKYLSRM